MLMASFFGPCFLGSCIDGQRAAPPAGAENVTPLPSDEGAGDGNVEADPSSRSTDPWSSEPFRSTASTATISTTQPLSLALAPALARAIASPLGTGVSVKWLAAGELCSTSGMIDGQAQHFSVTDDETRAVAATNGDGQAAVVKFTYNGPTTRQQLLADGTPRIQIGVKLRSQDTCNSIYIMWHLVPDTKIWVQVKNNPGQTTHAQCSDRGYSTYRSSIPWPPSVKPIVRGEQRIMAAQLAASGELQVIIDGVLAWKGSLPMNKIQFKGPAGVRTDNAQFSFDFGIPTAPLISCNQVTAAVKD